MKKSISLFAFMLPLFVLSQLKEEDFIKWSENRKLTWDDFKAPPQKIAETAAMTTTHLGFSYKIANGKITYAIDCRFQKSRSWGLEKNDWVLQHEQGHFDIAEIFARRLNKATAEYKFNQSSFESDLGTIYQTIVAEKDRFQQQYDDETDHSRNKSKQEEWLKKISDELKQSKPWAGY